MTVYVDDMQMTLDELLVNINCQGWELWKRSDKKGYVFQGYHAGRTNQFTGSTPMKAVACAVRYYGMIKK